MVPFDEKGLGELCLCLFDITRNILTLEMQGYDGMGRGLLMVSFDEQD